MVNTKPKAIPKTNLERLQEMKRIIDGTTKTEIKPINKDQAPKTHTLPIMTDKIEITKNDAAYIVDCLCSLIGYQGILHKSQNSEVINIIKRLANMVDPQ